MLGQEVILLAWQERLRKLARWRPRVQWRRPRRPVLISMATLVFLLALIAYQQDRLQEKGVAYHDFITPLELTDPGVATPLWDIDAHIWQHLSESGAPEAAPDAQAPAPDALAGDAAAAAPATAEAIEASLWPELAWPVEGRVLKGFGWQHSDSLADYRLHRGLAIAAPAGVPVRAAAAGVVVQVHETWAHGLEIRLRHAGGLQTVYAGLSTPAVQVGEMVAAGQVIGLIGNPGGAVAGLGPHLHFAVHTGAAYTDPAPHLPAP